MHTLQVKPFTGGAEDEHGNAVGTWGSPRDWMVRGYGPGGLEEPYRPNRDLSLISWTVYADANEDLPGPRDVVVVDGEDFEVNGEPADWTRGPWPFGWAGAVVELTRAEG